MAIGEAAAQANLALATAWLEARARGDRDRMLSLTDVEATFRRTGERKHRGSEAVDEALASIEAGVEPALIAIVPDGPFATATVAGGRGFETWRLRIVDGLVGDVIVDPDPFA